MMRTHFVFCYPHWEHTFQGWGGRSWDIAKETLTLEKSFGPPKITAPCSRIVGDENGQIQSS